MAVPIILQCFFWNANAMTAGKTVGNTTDMNTNFLIWKGAREAQKQRQLAKTSID